MGWDVRLKAALVQVGCLFGPSKSFTGLGIPSCSWNGKVHGSKTTDPKLKNVVKSKTVFRCPSDEQNSCQKFGRSKYYLHLQLSD